MEIAAVNVSGGEGITQGIPQNWLVVHHDVVRGEVSEGLKGFKCLLVDGGIFVVQEDVDAGKDPGSLLVEVENLSVNSQELIEQLRGSSGSSLYRR